MNWDTFHVFYTKDFAEYITIILDSITQEIQKQDENYVLNVNETEYIKYLFEKYKISRFDIHFDQLYVSDYTAEIPAESFPKSFHVTRGQRYPRQIIRFHIPFSGPAELLKYKPYPQFLLWTHPVHVLNNEICFDLTNFYDNRDRILQEKDEILNNMVNQFALLRSCIDEFNNSLENKIKEIFTSIKTKILNKNNFLASLGIPIKKVENISETFSIPISAKKEIKLDRPEVTEKEYKPEPTIDDSIYFDILKIIYDVGKVIERYPSSFSYMKEVDLRNHLLLYLQPHFSLEGSVTGETFNRSGRTDILIQYKNTNVFIAECKFWKDKTSYLNAINQLLRYLTWRDSKAALIIFIKNKNFSDILEKMKNFTQLHKNCLGFVNENAETWFNYRFHVLDDKNKEIKLAVLAFQIRK